MTTPENTLEGVEEELSCVIAGRTIQNTKDNVIHALLDPGSQPQYVMDERPYAFLSTFPHNLAFTKYSAIPFSNIIKHIV